MYIYLYVFIYCTVYRLLLSSLAFNMYTVRFEILSQAVLHNIKSKLGTIHL